MASEKPSDLSDDEIIEQIEEAAEIVEVAIEEKDTAYAAKVLEQLETWQKQASLTSSEAKQFQEAMAEQLAEMRTQLNTLMQTQAPPSTSQARSDPLPPTVSNPQTPKPHTGESLTERQSEDEEGKPVLQAQPAPEKPQPKRRAI